MKRSARDIFVDIFVALVVFAIVGSFVALVIAHIRTLGEEPYQKSIAYQETIFISALTLGLMIVLILPHIVNKEQVIRGVRKEIENYWKTDYQKDMNQFISKSERDYANISRMIAYILKHKRNFYWAMAWAGDSVVAYIKRFKECPADFQLNEKYFAFSLMIMNISFKKRKEGTFLEDNIDLGHNLKSDGNLKSLLSFKKHNFNEKDVSELWDKLSKGKELTPEENEAVKKSMKEINDKIYNGEEITIEEQNINAVKELKRVILRYIKWQCIIYIEMKEYKELPNNVTHLIKEHLDPAFKRDFEDMVNKTLKSFHYVDEEQFINDIVEKVEPEEREKVHGYLENMFKGRLS